MKPSWEQQADRGIELLQLCCDLQSEKDGVDRPKINSIDKTKTNDQFAKDIQTAATNMAALYKLFPLMNGLAKLGKRLEAEGLVQTDLGGDYSEVALQYFMKQQGLTPDESGTDPDPGIEKIRTKGAIDELEHLLASSQRTYGASENPFKVVEIEDIKSRLNALNIQLATKGK